MKLANNPFRARRQPEEAPAPSRLALQEVVRIGSIAETAVSSPLYTWILQELTNRAQSRLRALLDSQSTDLHINDGLRRACKEAEESIQFIQTLIDTAIAHKRQAVELLALDLSDSTDEDMIFNPLNH